MTAIVGWFDGETAWLAADGFALSNSGIRRRVDSPKIHRVGPWLVGHSGDVWVGHYIRDSPTLAAAETAHRFCFILREELLSLGLKPDTSDEKSAGLPNLDQCLILARPGECWTTTCELLATNREVLKRRGFLIIAEDFLSLTVSGWDRVVANPPFSLGQDIAHVTKMWELLAPGGRLVAVMSPSWRTRQSKRHAAFRALCVAAGGEWLELPAESFKASGTNVNTGIIVLDRAAS